MEIRLVKFGSLDAIGLGTRWSWQVISHTGWIAAKGWSLTEGQAKLDAFAYATTLIPNEAEEWLS